MLLTAPVPNLPWQDRPAGDSEPLWRYSENPVIDRRPFPGGDRVFNSAVVAKDGGFVGVFRNDGRNGLPFLHVGHSADGLRWAFESEPIRFHQQDGTVASGPEDYGYQYDPRCVEIDGRYFVIWCNDFHGPTLGLGYTDDFKTFHQLENAFVPYNRNGVLFPKKFPRKDGTGDDYLLLNRPSDSGHTPFGDIFLSRSPDLVHWGRHRFVMGASGPGWWQNLKIGAGPAPIETTEGWLLFYHAVTKMCNGYVYSMGVALLDRDEPDRVLMRGDGYVLQPERPYETTGQTDNVVFPCAALCDGDTGRMAIYYGGADTFTNVAFTTVEIILDWLKQNRMP
ncbi:MAG: glycoside hydrolase family 130 protein [Planctomycetota bacterium]